MKHAVPLQPMENNVRAGIYTAGHERPRTTAGGYGLKKAAANEEPTKKTCVLKKLHFHEQFTKSSIPYFTKKLKLRKKCFFAKQFKTENAICN